MFIFSDIWEETEGDQSDDDDKTDESMPPDEIGSSLQCTILV